MHLLRTNPNGQLELENFLGPDFPKYAILSHTWGKDGDELTYRDIKEGKGRNKAGFAKIEFCLNQAACDGLEYSWVDTCCIDKANNTELFEAINSMFKWYNNAAKCYAYLEDVSTQLVIAPQASARDPNTTSKSRFLNRAWETEFRRSRWFTRGWTLQELLAPKTVEFYSAQRQLLCDRASELNLIFSITGISVAAFQGHALHSFTVRERMSWTRKRQTTREEDQAYCLLGIFNVSMSLIYGEGKEKAMARLKKKISRPTTVREVVNKLPVISGAAFDSREDEGSPTCLEKTRVKLLQHIETWAMNAESKTVYWLRGLAGTGKSTVARTVARSFASASCLGASFFFRRGAGKRSSASCFFPTISAQLATKIPEVAEIVLGAIQAEPAIAEKSLADQFEALIYRPYAWLQQNHTSAPIKVFVIDALDECEDDEDIRTIIRSISRLRNGPFRIFITSRPELPIRLGFQKLDPAIYEELALHDVPSDVVKRDITTFLDYEFQNIQEYHELPPGWPGSHIIDILAEMASPLFIFASTVCRYVASSSDPRKKLAYFLEFDRSGQLTGLERLYFPILEQIFRTEDNEEREELAGEFRQVIGTIVLLARPLSVVSLAALLDTDEYNVTRALRPLHSVLNVPTAKTRPVQLFHQSFRDFLLDPKKEGSTPFWVNEENTHSELSRLCMKTLAVSQWLRQNICDNADQSFEKKAYSGVEIEAAIPPDLDYSCRYWYLHTHKIEYQRRKIDLDHFKCLMEKRLLFWLEALSLLECTEESGKVLRELRDIPTIFANDYFIEVLADARNFASRNRRLLDEAPLQIYSSALLFAPVNSIVRSTYVSLLPDWVRSLPQTQEDYGSCECTFDARSKPVTAVAIAGLGDYSLESARVATGTSDGKIYVWNRVLDTLQYTLEGHEDLVRALSFSFDTRLLLSASDDKTIKLWDTQSWVMIREFKGHLSGVHTVRFSPDDLAVISISTGGTMNIYDVKESSLSPRISLYPDEQHDRICAYSPESGLLAYICNDRSTLLIVNADTEETLHEFSASYVENVVDVAFSPDGTMIAAGSQAGWITIWDCRLGAKYTTLCDDYSEVTAVVFSDNCRLLVQGSSIGTVNVWSIERGIPVYSYSGHAAPITSLAVEGQWVVSGSQDGTARLWRSVSATKTTAEQQPVVPVAKLLICRDGNTVVSMNHNGSVKIWDTTMATPRCLPRHKADPMALELASNGTFYAVGFRTAWGTQVVCTESGNLLHDLPDQGPIDIIAISKDDIFIASAHSSRSTVRIWNAITGKLIKSLDMPRPGITALVFSEDGKRIAACSINGTIVLWDIVTGDNLRLAHSPSDMSGDMVDAVAFSPDGRTLLATVSSDVRDPPSQVLTWDISNGNSLHNFVLSKMVKTSIIGSFDLLAASPNGPVATANSHFLNSLLYWDYPDGASRYNETYDTVIHRMWYTAEDDLCTNRGQLSKHSRSKSIFVGKKWIYCDGRAMLHIPNEYRSAHVTVAGSKIAIGCTSGEVIYFDLDFNATDKITPKVPKPVKLPKRTLVRPRVPDKPLQFAGRRTQVAKRDTEVAGPGAVGRPLDDFPDYFQDLVVPEDLKGFARSPRPAPKPPGAVTRR